MIDSIFSLSKYSMGCDKPVSCFQIPYLCENTDRNLILKRCGRPSLYTLYVLALLDLSREEGSIDSYMPRFVGLLSGVDVPRMEIETSILLASNTSTLNKIEIPQSVEDLVLNAIKNDPSIEVIGAACEEPVDGFLKEDEIYNGLYRGELVNNSLLCIDLINNSSNGAYDEYKAVDLDKHPIDRKYCDCGADLVIRYEDGQPTTLSCCNRYCFYKIGEAYVEFARKLGIKGLGYRSIEPAMKRIWLNRALLYGESYITYKDLFSAEFLNLTDGALNNLVQEMNGLVKTYEDSLPVLITHISLPYIGKTIASAFNPEWMVRKPNFNEVVERLTERGIHSHRLSVNLYRYLSDIKAVYELTMCTVEERKMTKVCITGKINIAGISSKDHFIREVNKELRKRNEEIDYRTSLSRGVNYLINDSGMASGKDANARRLGVRICTSKEFLEEMGLG